MTQEIVKHQEKFELMGKEEVTAELMGIRQFHNTVKKLLVPNLDYGVIPGAGTKPTLLKPGAEKLAKMHGLSDEYEIVDKAEDWDKGFFRYLIKCKLIHIPTGKLVSEGVGECNSMESKYRYRWVGENEIPAELNKDELKKKWHKGNWYTYRVPNDDVYSVVNTILKIAKKRSLIDATLSACRLSAVFTQDIEDLGEYIAKPEQEKDVSEAEIPEGGNEPVNDEKLRVILNKKIGELAKKAGFDDQGLANVIHSIAKQPDTQGLTISELNDVVNQLQKMVAVNSKKN